MKVNNFLFRFKIFILLFSFAFNVFMPSVCLASRMRSGGQLSLAVEKDMQKVEQKSRRELKKEAKALRSSDTKSSQKQFVSINSENCEELFTTANMQVSVDKKVDKKVEGENTENKEIGSQNKIEQEKSLQVQDELKAALPNTQKELASEEKNKDVDSEKIDQVKNVKEIAAPAKKEESLGFIINKPVEKAAEPVIEKKEYKKEQEEAAPKKSFIIQQELEKQNKNNAFAAQEKKNNQSQNQTQDQIQNKTNNKYQSRSLIKKYPGYTGTAADNEETVVFNFEDVDLANVAAYVESLFGIKFIPDDVVNPMGQNSKALSGNKVSFKTQKPMTKKQAWDLFSEFLNMAGLALIPQSNPSLYRVTVIAEAKKAAIPVYINHDPDKLPDSGIIRYGYFVKDCPLDTIKSVLESLRSSVADLLILNDHNAFIITDNAYNIKILMKIVKELDTVTMPQTMSVLKMYKAEAKYAAEIYSKLTQEGENAAMAARLFGPKAVSKSLYFPKKAKVFVDERTNSLVLLGSVEAIQTIEDFVRKYIDVDVETPYSPLYVYQLKYADCNNVANMMTELVRFGDKESKAGALRGGDKYFKNMTFTAEPEGNRLIIRGDYDDYLKVKDIIDQIDEEPKQVNIEILILSLEIIDQKELGVQLRNQFKSPDGSQFNFQTSGITLGSTAKSIVLNSAGSGAYRLLGDLISLVTGSAAGATAVSLGSDKFGVWGIFGIFDQLTNTQIVSNPFLTVTNNTKANVKLGDTHRVATANVVGTTTTNAFGDYNAFIDVTVTPKINSDGMIVTDVNVKFDSFVGDLSKITREVNTSVVLSNHGIAAIGGLMKDREDDNLSRVPVLGDIPVLGWLFKNKKKQKTKDDLLILINANIIDPTQEIKDSTRRHLKEYREAITSFESVQTSKDPIDRAFFRDKPADFKLNDYIFARGQEHAEVIGQQELLGIGRQAVKSDVDVLKDNLEGFKERRTGKKIKPEKRKKEKKINKSKKQKKIKAEKKDIKKTSRGIKSNNVDSRLLA